MRIRNLFIKIFLWFWLANTVVIAALALVMWMYPYALKPGPLSFDFEHEKKIRSAFEVIERLGNDAIEAQTRELDAGSMFRTYWVDSQNRELLGRTVSPALIDYAKKNSDQIRNGKSVMTGPPTGYIIVPLSDSKGNKITALAEFGGFAGSDGPGRGAKPDPRGDRGPERGAGRGPERDRGPNGGFNPASYLQIATEPRVFLPRLAAVVLAAGLGCYALARYLTSPVRKLQHAVRQLAAGDLTARVANSLRTRGDEIGDLGRDFDRMAQQVESLVSTQNRLLRDVSHELRSPLARLNVALELASRDASSAAAPALGRAVRESDRLNALIGQLLTLARLEGGATQPQQTTVDLKKLVTEISADADFEAAARVRRVRIVRCDECSIIGTRELLHSAIENVTRNAVLYTGEGSEVEVSLVCGERNGMREALLEIRDHGPGVPEESLADIFRAFHRVSDARDRRSGGVGLGLAITEQAVRLHGGSVRAMNAVGGGLAVQIRLPCGPKDVPGSA